MVRKESVLVLVLMALLTITTYAAAGIYKLVDENGHVTYTNAPAKSAQKLQSGATPPALVAKAMTTAPLAAKSFPKVTNDQQRKRDINRRQILESELATETRLLEEIEYALNEAIQDLKGVVINHASSMINAELFEDESVKKLRDQISSHERNIMALRTELENL